ncbi:MAG: hypothetical protein AB7O65_08035 [Candidatus Korobacteraceae bacterium]
MKPVPPATSSMRPKANANHPSPADSSRTAQTRELSPDLWLYRQHTIALLRKYFRLSVELGRLPSLLGREFFRSHVSSYRMSSFEDGVIFVHDVERCLERLEYDAQQVIARITFQEYTAEEAANLLNCARRTVVRRYMEALDELSYVFLATGLLRAFPSPSKSERKPATSGDISACAVVTEVTEATEAKKPAASRVTERVKPPQSAVCSQAALGQGNRFSLQLSHLPPAG